MLNHNRSRKLKRQTVESLRGDEGFALIITITLLTFLVLVLFAMTSLTRVETRMAGGSQQVSIARENAKLALDAAIAQLQHHAGPDDRITARADIDPANDENPYWTGVWDDTAFRTWLVSGNEDVTNPPHFSPVPNLDRTMGGAYQSPSSVPGVTRPSTWPTGVNPSFVRLVGAGSTGDNGAAGKDGRDPIHPLPGTANYQVPGGVVVPKVPIFSRSFPGLQTSTATADYVVGHYAFWVGDQGVKASVALPEKHLDVDAYSGPGYSVAQEEEMLRRLRQMMPQRMWFEGDDPAFTILNDYPQFDLRTNLTTRDENERLGYVIDYWQTRNALPLDVAHRPDFGRDTSTTPNRDQLKDRFHDITAKTYGVLASTEGSGLKIDLSAGGTSHQDYLDFPFNLPATAVNPGLGTATVQLFAPPNLSNGAPALVIAPIVTELVTKYTIWQDSTTGEMRVRLEAEVELWNPYTAELDLGSSDALILRLEDLETIDVEHSFESGVIKTIDLAASDAHYIPLDQATGYSSTMDPGEIVHFSYTSPDLPALDGTAVVEFTLTDPAGTGATPTIELDESTGATVDVELWLLVGTALSPVPGSGAGIDSVISSLTVQPVGGVVPDSFLPFQLGPYNAQDDSNAPNFGYNFRLKDEFDDPEWLTFYDPRTIGLRNGGGIDAIESEEDPLLAHAEPFDDHILVPQLLRESQSASDRIRLFELPIQEQVNMGALQHLYYHNEPAYALGNEWGDYGVNLDFDRYFLSGIPQTGNWEVDWDFPVPNTRLVPYRSIDQSLTARPTPADLRDPESAEHLLVEGSFNINSTSVNAWRSVIGAMNIRLETGGDNFDPNPANNANGEWIYAASPGGRPLTSAVFRFPQTGHLLNSPYQSKSGLETSPDLARIQGVRELTEEQVSALAYEIVYLLRNPHLLSKQPPSGIPFVSLSEFVGSGIIQQAIDNCDFQTLSPGNPLASNPTAANINGVIPAYSAAFVSQADIITGMAPFMAARSDTFLVRAYGDSHNPATGETLARAYCEAIVQRVPATLNPNGNVVNPASGGIDPFGRRFEVVYFRWMTPGEL